jgi:pyruvate dehydrogenase phosphatase
LSEDHSLTNPIERDRLVKEHPNEPDVLGEASDPRVKGMLQPSRGIGDGLYKSQDYFSIVDRRALGLPSGTLWRPPYTTALPQVSQHKLTPDDVFLVIATDGLWMDLSSEQVVQAVGEFLARRNSSTPPSPPTASGWLVKQALLASVSRGITSRTRAVPSEQELLSFVVQVPPGRRRSIHDDITVTVVLFDKDALTSTALPLKSKL